MANFNYEKKQATDDLWYKLTYENREQIHKVNHETKETILNMKPATKADYIADLAVKKTKGLSKTNFIIPKGKKALKVVMYCSTNYGDISNPQKGVTSGKRYTALKNGIGAPDPNIKTVVIFAGNLLGEEWRKKNLESARIDANGVVHFVGLNERKKDLIADIKLARTLGADVYLLQGAQEHNIEKETGRDIFEEVVNELGDPGVKYIEEGTSVICNIVSYGAKAVHNTMALHANMIGKAQTAKADYDAGLKCNVSSISADVTFVSNGTTAGKYGENYFHVSGQSLFKPTTKGKKPDYAPKNYNVFTIYPEGEHELTVLEGSPENLYSQDLTLEKKLYEERKKKATLARMAKEKLEEEINEVL